MEKYRTLESEEKEPAENNEQETENIKDFAIPGYVGYKKNKIFSKDAAKNK